MPAAAIAVLAAGGGAVATAVAVTVAGACGYSKVAGRHYIDVAVQWNQTIHGKQGSHAS